MISKEIIFIVEEATEGGYTANALGHSIYTEADNWEELKHMIRDAVKCHFKKEDRPQIINIFKNHYWLRIAKEANVSSNEDKVKFYSIRGI